MTILAKKTSSGLDLGPLAPAGIHQGVCVDTVDLGVVDSTYEGRTTQKHMARVIWQLLAPDQRRYLVAKKYNLTLNEKSSLRKDLTSWRQRPPSPEEEDKGFDVERFVGVPCTLIVTHAVKGDRTYANVDGVMPRDKQKPKLIANGYTRATMEPEEPEIDDFEDTPRLAVPAAEVGDTPPPIAVTDDDIPF